MMLLNVHILPLLLASSILTALLVVGGVALVLAIVIVIIFHFFSVETDVREQEITEILPGANCGGCGYSGCQGYAAALASGKDAVLTKCTAGGQETAEALAAYFGQAPAAYVPKQAFVQCQGGTQHIKIRYQYSGSMNCQTAHNLFGGPGSCAYGCLGFGDCVRACEYDAIHVKDGVAVVDPENCVACGACVRACPRKLISIQPKYTDLHLVRCRNPQPGKVVRNQCDIGCIGCTLCVKKCPSKAIHMEDSVAVIDQDLCTHCGVCAQVCPTKAIVAGL